MSTVKILESVPRPQFASPFFYQLPVDIRLIIYLMVFAGSKASVWLDGQFTKTKLGYRWQHILFREGQCCFYHGRGGFALLLTCRKLYAEAFPTYWSSTILHVLRSNPLHFDGCELQHVCAYLPVPIKECLHHIRNVRLPVINYARPACDESNWAPTLLKDFPKLKTLALPHTGLRRLAAAAGGITTPDMLRVTGGQYEVCVNYFDVGPFQVRTGESPAGFLERTTGIQRSSGVTILSFSWFDLPYDAMTQPDRPVTHKFFNWATGMVFQTTLGGEHDESLWHKAISAEEGSDWSRCYYVTPWDLRPLGPYTLPW